MIEPMRQLSAELRRLACLRSNINWKPHEKSMSLGRLALHVAELPAWIRVTLAQDELDAASAPRPPAEVKDKAELLA